MAANFRDSTKSHHIHPHSHSHSSSNSSSNSNSNSHSTMTKPKSSHTSNTNANNTKLHHHGKRKLNELEDITNNSNKKSHTTKKLKVTFGGNTTTTTINTRSHSHQQRILHHQIPPSPPEQYRSPSPLDSSPAPTPTGVEGSVPPSTSKPKSVSFELPNDSPAYENSPLLTPKEEDDDDEDDDKVDLGNSSTFISTSTSSSPRGTTSRSISPPTSATDDDTVSIIQSNKPIKTDGNVQHDLNSNPDYISLTSTLRLLNDSKLCINQDIQKLSTLNDKIASTENKDEIIEFFLNLLNNKLQLSSPNAYKIMKAPTINWSDYSVNLAKVNSEFERQVKQCQGNEEESLYTSLKLFDNQQL